MAPNSPQIWDQHLEQYRAVQEKWLDTVVPLQGYSSWAVVMEPDGKGPSHITHTDNKRKEANPSSYASQQPTSHLNVVP